MSVGEVCNRTVVVAPRRTPLDEAARLMREHHVGSLVVIDDTALGRKPVGIVTDRDLVLEVLAPGIDAATLTVEEVMTPELVTAVDAADTLDTLAMMRTRGVRRVPVVDSMGVLVGILAMDDLLALLAEQIDGMVKVIAREQAREARTRK